MNPDRWRVTTADMVRTGDTFITHFAYATRRPAITVDIVHRERFNQPGRPNR